MKRDKIEELFNRLARLSAATRDKSGGKTAWTVTDADGQTHQYVLNGVKSDEDMEDDIANLIVWIWNAKDYLKKRAKERGKNTKFVEEAFRVDTYLSTLSELANGLKHGAFERFRLSDIYFTIPQRAISSVIFGEPNQVEMDVAEARWIEYRLPIIDRNAKEMGDAFEYVERAMAPLEDISDRIDESN